MSLTLKEMEKSLFNEEIEEILRSGDQETSNKDNNKLLFIHKENKNIYEILSVQNVKDIPVVIYKDTKNKRKYTRDFFMFLKNMELLED
jgi:hypothetical protein